MNNVFPEFFNMASCQYAMSQTEASEYSSFHLLRLDHLWGGRNKGKIAVELSA
jgi:hypothetical protein